jgi:flagellar basal body L-ring protein FlgH
VKDKSADLWAQETYTDETLGAQEPEGARASEAAVEKGRRRYEASLRKMESSMLHESNARRKGSILHVLVRENNDSSLSY